MDVHLHEEATARWAQSANHGELIDATLQDSGFAAPRASAAHVHLVGDAASVPAMRTILDAFPHLRATLWLEQQHESEQDIPLHLRPSDEVVRIPRGDGTQLTAAVQAGLTQSHAQGRLETAWFWLACEATANRALLVHLRGELGIPRSSIAAMAYWKAT